MLNIVIPMAGRGRRFVEGNHRVPKPLIEVHGRSLTEIVIDNITPKRHHRFIFVCLRKHVHDYAIDAKLRDLAPQCELVVTDGVTEGAACTVLLAKRFIDDENELMLANCDQWIDVDIDRYLRGLTDRSADGLIMTMTSDEPRHSYVGLDAEGNVTRVVEKTVISPEATVGIYNYARGCDFVEAAERMIRKNERVKGEFYVAPVYNQLLEMGGKVVSDNIGDEYVKMFPLGIPEDIVRFVARVGSQALRRH